MYFFRVYQFRENDLNYVIYPIHIWWVYLGKTKWSTRHWLGAIFSYPHQRKGAGIRKLSSLSNGFHQVYNIHSWSSKTLVLRVTKTQLWVQADINSNWTSQVYQTICCRQSRGAPESHSIVPCCMNNLYKTAQALQLTKQQKVSTDRRQEDDDWFIPNYRQQKEAHKTNQTVQQHVPPIVLLRTCVQLYYVDLFFFFPFC